jgi:hypothetical protein
VWTFDYPAGRLLLRTDGRLPAHAPAHAVPLGFPVDPKGAPRNSFPRLDIRVDGASLPMLFDTGATLVLTPEALAELGDGRGARRGTSFIVADVFDRWRAAHPDWRVVEQAEAGTGQPILEVPRIEVGGHVVGPVWFTRRPNANFRSYMSAMMDAPVEGALGGSALRYFRVHVDYPRARAVFERVESR